MIHPGKNLIALSLPIATALLALGCQTDGGRRAIDIDDLGPQVGEMVPDFTLPDQNGSPVSLQSVLGPNGGILLFYRSADW